MSWPHYKEVVTVVDVLEIGACQNGVLEWLEENDYTISDLTEKHKHNGWILEAAFGTHDSRSLHGASDSFGYGSSYEDGDGYGIGHTVASNVDGDGCCAEYIIINADGYGAGNVKGDGYSES